jgi:hypothetical protein
MAPRSLKDRLKRLLLAIYLPASHGVKRLNVRWGSFRRLRPFSSNFGWDRGQPIDRFYIEQFLQKNASDIRGDTLEMADAAYTRRFGGSRVTHSDVLHATPGNQEATLVGDLASGQGIPRSAFDCIIFTQTLLCVYDVRSALATVHSALRPGGVLLATFPGISQISRHDADRWGDYWRFTVQSAQRLFGDAFPGGKVQVEAHGNVLAATAFLHGLAREELRPEELSYHDPDYPMLITVRAEKARQEP